LAQLIDPSAGPSGPEAVIVHPTTGVDDLAVRGPGTQGWHFCHEGARIGTHCRLGQNVFVASGVLGVPVRQSGWMSWHGYRLPSPDEHGIGCCPVSGWRYREVEPDVLRCLNHPQDVPLPLPASKASDEAVGMSHGEPG
jgi:hypothetical protein